jgi:hypothetical protein
MRAIFISPHFDDAVFSCGGLIAHLSDHCETQVWTIFGGKPIIPRTSPLTRWLHSTCNSPNAEVLNSVRKSEDLKSLNRLKTKGQHFSFLDSVYRVDFFFRPLYRNTCLTPPHSSDRILIEKISRKLVSLLKPTDLILTPLGIGYHVDHLVARQAVELHRNDNICYFEDVPYNIGKDSTRFQKPNKCKPIEIMLESNDLHLWKLANSEYVSQLSMVDPNSDLLDTYISRFKESCFPLLATTSAEEILSELLPEIRSVDFQ